MLKVLSLSQLLSALLALTAQADPLYAWANFVGQPGGSGRADGTGSTARFSGPSAVAVDGAGNVFVPDKFNNTIRKVSASGVVTTLAGLAGVVGSADGTGSAARFYYPSGVAVDSAGNFYVADQRNCTIRKVSAGGFVSTIGGMVGVGSGADGTGSAAWFDYPSGVAVDNAGILYVADWRNNRISKGTPVLPALLITAAGGSVVVSWPDTGIRTLQQNSTVANAPGWTTSGYPISTANGTNSITITNPTGSLFLRLRQ